MVRVQRLGVALLMMAAVSACGTPAAMMPSAGSPVSAMAKANPFLGLTKVTLTPGGGPGHKNAKSHFSAKTQMSGYLNAWDEVDLLEVDYNGQEITVPQKLVWIGEALEQAAASLPPAEARTVREMKAKLAQPNPLLGLTNIRSTKAPQIRFLNPNAEYIVAQAPNGGTVALANPHEVGSGTWVIRNEASVSGRMRWHQLVKDAFAKAAQDLEKTDPKLAGRIVELNKGW